MPAGRVYLFLISKDLFFLFSLRQNRGVERSDWDRMQSNWITHPSLCRIGHLLKGEDHLTRINTILRGQMEDDPVKALRAELRAGLLALRIGRLPEFHPVSLRIRYPGEPAKLEILSMGIDYDAR